MTDVRRDWRIELIEAYPRLFQRQGGGSAPSCYPECGEGWRDLLERACGRIQAAVDADGRRLTVAQIKEKFGTLRFYWKANLSHEANAKVEEAIDLAEARSGCTCEVCGEEGRLHKSGAWLMTRCSAHAQGSPVEIKRGFHNVLVVQRVVGGRSRVSCRRYDRTTDAFVDVDPASLGIEE
jgi:hypothetical protein